MTQKEFVQLSAFSEGLERYIPFEKDAEKRAEMEKDLKKINEMLLPELLRRYGQALSQQIA